MTGNGPPDLSRWDALEEKIRGRDFRFESQRGVLLKLAASGRGYQEGGKDSLADKMHKRIMEKLETVRTGRGGKSPGGKLNFKKVSDHLRERSKEETLNLYQKNKSGLPDLEQSFFEEEIEKHGADEISPPRRLSELREQISDSVVRFKTRKKNPEGAGDALQNAGPYNARKNIGELLRQLGESEPLWAEDFKKLYGSLWEISGLVE